MKAIVIPFVNPRSSGHHVHVTLSRRNLKTLLLKLDEPDSARTLVRMVETDLDKEVILRVTAEDDDIHYVGRIPGEVHPREEERLSPWDNGPFGGYHPCGCINVQDEQRRCPKHQRSV